MVKVDRSREFLNIVKCNELEQIEVENNDFYGIVLTRLSKINNLFIQINKMTNYEKFKISCIIKDIQHEISELKEINIECKDSTIKNNIVGFIRSKILEFNISLNSILSKSKSRSKKRNSNLILEQEEKKLDSSPEQYYSTQKYARNQSIPVYERSFAKERKNISRSISEIGNLVEDLHLRVTLQEEQLRRVDEITTEADSWSKTTLNTLKELYDFSNRTGIINYFIFMLIFIFIFFLFLKSNIKK